MGCRARGACTVQGIEPFIPAIHNVVHGYLAHKKTPPSRIPQKDYTYGPTVVLGWGAVSYERGTPVGFRASALDTLIPDINQYEKAANQSEARSESSETFV